MKTYRFALTVGFFLLAVSFAGAADDLAPLSASLFFLYGTPVQPLSLGQTNYDGLGLDFLAEYQPSHYASVGLSYETATFYGLQAFTAGSLNVEGRLFPFAGMKLPYNPYISGGAGLNLAGASPTQWGGSTALKAGIGTKVAFVGPMSLDFAVESHWMGNSPNFFQYVDARVGIDYAIALESSAAPTPTPVQTPAASPVESPMPSPVVRMTPTETPTPMAPMETDTPTSVPYVSSPSPTPTESELLIENTPTPAPGEGSVFHSRVKKFYLMGINAFYAHKYQTAVADLKKAVSIKEKVAYYYYAESYGTIGVIYQFHLKGKNHLKLALENYKKAAKIDPTTPAVKKYYKKLKAQLAQVSAVSASEDQGAAATPTDSSIPAATAAPQDENAAPTAVPESPAPTSTGNSATVPIDTGNTK